MVELSQYRCMGEFCDTISGYINMEVHFSEAPNFNSSFRSFRRRLGI